MIQFNTPHYASTDHNFTSSPAYPYFTADATFTFPISYTGYVSLFNTVFAMAERGFQYVNTLTLTGFTTGSNTKKSGTGGWLSIGY